MRNTQLFLLTLFIVLITTSCCIFKHGDTTYYEYTAPSRNTNVCGHLKDSVILYCVFVDVGRFHPFSEYDVTSTMDSVEKAACWLETQSAKSNIKLSVKPVLHKTRGKIAFHESRTLVRPHLHPFKMPGEKRKYTRYTNQWADYISKYAGRGVKQRRSSKVTRRRIIDLESMLAALRDKYTTDNVAIMFFVNGYFEHDACLTFNSYTNGPDVEYSVITQKNPAAVAHELLHLFGAVDLYPHQHHPGFNYKDIKEKYPNEIMRIAHKNINKLIVSPITEYYVGWNDTMPNPDLRLLYHQADVLPY